jgi:hypothetical protein
LKPNLQVKLLEFDAAVTGFCGATKAYTPRALEILLKANDDLHDIVEVTRDNEALLIVLKAVEDADARLDAVMAKLGIH